MLGRSLGTASTWHLAVLQARLASPSSRWCWAHWEYSWSLSGCVCSTEHSSQPLCSLVCMGCDRGTCKGAEVWLCLTPKQCAVTEKVALLICGYPCVLLGWHLWLHTSLMFIPQQNLKQLNHYSVIRQRDVSALFSQFIMERPKKRN